MDKRNYLIAGLLVAVIFMGIDSTWDVKITEITQKTLSGATQDKEPTHTTNSATFSVKFTKPGDYAEYDIKVTNNGTLNAKLKNITISPEDVTNAQSGIKYTVSGVTEETTTLDSNQTNTVTVKAEWVGTDTSMPEETTKQVTITLDYEQY